MLFDYCLSGYYVTVIIVFIIEQRLFFLLLLRNCDNNLLSFIFGLC